MRDSRSENLKRYFQEEWEEYFEYNPDKIKKFLIPILKDLLKQSKLGPVVADIGCGPVGVTNMMDTAGLKIIRVDYLATKKIRENSFEFNGDLDKIDNLPFATRRSLLETRNWLGKAGKEPQVDSMIISQVINHLKDYKIILQGLTKFIKPGGRIILFNKPNMGHKSSLLSDNAPKKNSDVVKFVERLGFETEIFKIDNFDHEGDDSDIFDEIDSKYDMVLVSRRLNE